MKNNRSLKNGNTKWHPYAGKSTALYSGMLLDGLDYFCDLLKKDKIELKNIYAINSCIVFLSISSLEAKFNERIFILKACIQDNPKFFEFIETIHRNIEFLPIEKKWNIIASISNGKKWNNFSEPFQSFEIIKSLRNELIHYKAEPMDCDEVPLNKLKQFNKILKLQSQKNINIENRGNWIHLIMGNKKLSFWLKEKTHEFSNFISDSLIGEIIWDFEKILINNSK